MIVLLVIIYMAAIIHLTGLSLNHVTGMNLIFGLGISVDFSVHIAHRYLTIKPPKHLQCSQDKREYKAK